MKKIIFFLSVTFCLVLLSTKLIHAVSLDDCEKDPSNNINDCINLFSNKVADLSSQKKTLSSQIAQFDTQLKLTQLKINSAQSTLAQLEKEIGVLGFRIGYVTDSIGKLENLVKERIVATYEQSYVSNLDILLSSNNFSDAILRMQYLKKVQENDKKVLASLQETKTNYATQKDDREAKQAAIEDQKKKLEVLQTSLDQQKAEKQQLLTVTNNDESKYASLLKDAQAQISAFKSFASSHGGSQILPAQPSPDGWYYNQRDERWGRQNIGSSSEQVWEVGCLLTASAMVMKKHGIDVNPGNVASNTSYFFADTAYMLIPWVGGKISSSWGFDRSTVDSKLSSGEPVIVGIKGGPFGQHFVVLKSGSNGDYRMNDPWNGPDLKFSDYYSISSIFQYGFYKG